MNRRKVIREEKGGWVEEGREKEKRKERKRGELKKEENQPSPGLNHCFWLEKSVL